MAAENGRIMENSGCPDLGQLRQIGAFWGSFRPHAPSCRNRARFGLKYKSAYVVRCLFLSFRKERSFFQNVTSQPPLNRAKINIILSYFAPCFGASLPWLGAFGKNISVHTVSDDNFVIANWIFFFPLCPSVFNREEDAIVKSSKFSLNATPYTLSLPFSLVTAKSQNNQPNPHFLQVPSVPKKSPIWVSSYFFEPF